MCRNVTDTFYPRIGHRLEYITAMAIVSTFVTRVISDIYLDRYMRTQRLRIDLYRSIVTEVIEFNFQTKRIVVPKNKNAIGIILLKLSVSTIYL